MQVFVDYSDIIAHKEVSIGSIDTRLMSKACMYMMYGVCGLVAVGLIWDLCNLFRKYPKKESKAKNDGKHLNFVDILF